jgi:hypothetical protein
MKKKDVQTGRTYIVKVSGKLSRVRLTSESPFGGWYGRSLETGRDVRVRSAARLRGEAIQGYDATSTRMSL